MSAALVLVPEAERAGALARYRAWLGHDAWATVAAVFRRVADDIRLMGEVLVDAFRHAYDSIGRLFGRRRFRFVAACEFYGVRRVTARQYRIYRRRVGRR